LIKNNNTIGVNVIINFFKLKFKVYTLKIKKIKKKKKKKKKRIMNIDKDNVEGLYIVII